MADGKGSSIGDTPARLDLPSSSPSPYKMDPAVYSALKDEFKKSPVDLARIGTTLHTATLQLTVHGALGGPVDTLPSDTFVVARDVLEMGAYWSIHNQDGSSFEKYLCQLTPFYQHSSPSTPVSPRAPTLLGLHLLSLLLSNRLPEYHTRLAQLDTTLPAIAFVAHLEQCLQEGTLHRVAAARNQLPVPEYAWFVDSLVERVREGLAASLEMAFSHLKATQVGALLMLEPAAMGRVVEFAHKRGWTVQGDEIILKSAKPDKASPTDQICTLPKQIINRALTYAAALEQIV